MRTAYQAGLDEIERARPNWPDHGPLLDRLESGLTDRTQHLATEDPTETAERRQERIEHEEIQRGVIGAQRAAVIELRDRGAINDQTLRTIERELDLEELRMEGSRSDSRVGDRQLPADGRSSRSGGRGTVGDPGAESVHVLRVVIHARLADPPCGFVRRFPQRVPLLHHPCPAGRRLGPGHVPRLVGHGREEDRVEPVDVDIVALVGPRVDLFELGLGLGEPCAEMGDDVADRPVRVALVAGDEALVERQGADQRGDLVPAEQLSVDLSGVRMLAVVGRLVCRRRQRLADEAATNAPLSGRPMASCSSSRQCSWRCQSGGTRPAGPGVG